MEYLDRYNGACHVRQDKRDIGSKVIRRSGVFPANVKRVCYYRRVNNKSWVNFLLYKKVILLSRQVLFSRNYLIIYSPSSLLLSSILWFLFEVFFSSSSSFRSRRNNKERKKEMARGEGNGARMSRIFSSFSFITSFRKYARLWSAHVFKVFKGSHVSERRDEFSRLHSSSTRCFATLRRTEWEFETNMKAARTSAFPFPPLLPPFPCAKEWPFIRFPTIFVD